MSRQSVAKAHEKIQELAWEPLYHEPVSQYGTDYTFQKAQEEGPAQAGSPVLLPDAGGEGPPGLWSGRRSYPREHVPAGPGTMARVAEAVPEHHPAAGDLRGSSYAAVVPHCAQSGAA